MILESVEIAQPDAAGILEGDSGLSISFESGSLHAQGDLLDGCVADGRGGEKGAMASGSVALPDGEVTGSSAGNDVSGQGQQRC